jgi:N-acetylglutamate synthase-like GNAT family acetyltransferase
MQSSSYVDRSIDYDDWSSYDAHMTTGTSPDTRTIPGGAAFEVQVRRARPTDLPQLQALADRCSFETLYRRFHGSGPSTIHRELERVASPTPQHRSWVAAEGEFIRGAATLAFGRDGSAEAAFLVEDAWFRRGLGRRLFGAMATEAAHIPVDTIVAWVQPDNVAARRFLRAVAPSARTRFAGMGELEMLVPVTVDRWVADVREPHAAQFQEIA